MWIAAVATIAAAGSAACGGSSARLTTVMPSSRSLGGYDRVIVRATSDFADGDQVSALEHELADALRVTCGYSEIWEAAGSPAAGADLVVEARIISLADIDASQRRQWGAFAGPAKLGVRVQLIETSSNQLVGAAEVVGESSSVPVAESATTADARARVVEKVSSYLRDEGCALDLTSTVVREATEGRDAEAVNEEGKALYRSRQYAEASVRFEEAASLRPDARYSFNLCVSLEAERKFDDALAACGRVYQLNPTPELRAKTDKRMRVILDEQKSTTEAQRHRDF